MFHRQASPHRYAPKLGVRVPSRRARSIVVTLGFLGAVLVGHAHITQAQPLRLSIEEDPTIAPVIVRVQQEVTVLTFYSSLVNLSFGSSIMGANRGILGNRSQPADGRYVLLISPEAQVITVRADGYLPEMLRLHRFRTQPGQQWSYRVEPVAAPRATGTLTIKTDPQGADLRITSFSDLPMRTPYTLTDFPVGDYRISLTLEGYERLDTQVTVEAGDTQNVTYVLTPVARISSRQEPTVTPRQPVSSSGTRSSTVADATLNEEGLVIQFFRRGGAASQVTSFFDPDVNVIVVELQTTQFGAIEDDLTASGLFADVVWKKRNVSRGQRPTAQEHSTLWLYPRDGLHLVRGKLWENAETFRFVFTLTEASTATPSPRVSNRQESRSPAIRAADAAWQAGRRDEAITQLERILKADPRNRAALLRLGDAYAATNQYSYAATQYAALIDADPAWAYPEARVKRCTAVLEATYALSATCERHLESYRSHAPTGRYATQAQHLLDLYRNPTEARLLTTRRDLRVFIQEPLQRKTKSLIYLWDVRCAGCISDLQSLYAFAATNPDVYVVVVAQDRMREHQRINERLTYTFADFRARNLENVRFYHDVDRQIERRLIPSTQRSTVVPRTLFLREATVTRIWNGIVAWDSPRLASAWDGAPPGW